MERREKYSVIMAMSTPVVVPQTELLRQFGSAPPGKLYCLYGDRSVFRLSLYAASHALLAGIPIALVDGSNKFDLYYIAEFARKAASQQFVERNIRPEQLLSNIFISRAFTCYQMEAVITDRLPAFVRKKRSPVAIIFGLLDTFYDEQAPLFEVKASVKRMIAALHRLKQENISILLTSLDMKLESKERNGLFPQLKTEMDQVFYLTESGGGRKMVRESQQRIEYRTRETA